MKWLLVIFMMSMNSGGEYDFYVYSDPSFETVEDCQLYAASNHAEITQHMQEVFGNLPIENAFCITERKLNEILPILTVTPEEDWV
jgi:hypothetical protein